MFNPERLSLIVQPIGDGGIRFFGYQTDEGEDDLITSGFLPNASDYGLRAYDLIFVSPEAGAEETYILIVDSIDANGDATLINAERGNVSSLSNLQGRVLINGASLNLLGRNTAGDGATGNFVGSTSDLSSDLLTATTYTPSAIDTANNEVDFASYPSLLKGYPLYVQTGNTDLTAGTIVYVWRDVTNYTSIKLCTTFADAMAGTNFIDLTVTDIPVFRLHRDPLQAIVVIPTGSAKNGSAGGWVRQGADGDVLPEWFGAVAGDATDSGEALAMALHYARTSYDTIYNVTVSGREQLFRTEVPLNYTGVTSPFSFLKDIKILGACAGKVVLSLAGTNTAALPGVHIIGDSTDVPSVGVLITRANDSAHTNPIGGGASNTFICPRVTGEFTKASFVNLNSDLSKIYGGYLENRYRGNDLKTTTAINCAIFTPITDYLDGLVCDFQEIIDASDTTAVGTTLDHIWETEVRRAASFSLTPTDITINGSNVAVMTFAAGELTANSIVNGDPIFLSSTNASFTLPRGNYTINQISGDTAELWLESGASAYDASAVTGTYTTGRVTNNTGPALIIGGYVRGVSIRGYILNYSAYSAYLDLQDGDINRLETALIHENGQVYNWRIIPHATDDREITEWTCMPMGDLASGGHIYKATGGDVYLKNFKFRDAYQQTGTAFWTSARIFTGDTTGLHLQNMDISVSSTTMLNTFNSATFASEPSGKVYDAETGKISYYPKGSYSPTLGGVTLTNLDSVAVFGAWQWRQLGDQVTVRGLASIDPTATGAVAFDVPLPVASNLVASDLFGFGIRQNSNSEQAVVSADATNDCATVNFVATGTTSFTMLIEFRYTVK